MAVGASSVSPGRFSPNPLRPSHSPTRRPTPPAQGLAAIADIYTTFCGLAGAHHADSLAAEHGLPAVDGVDLWPWISGLEGASPRTLYPIGATLGESTFKGTSWLSDDEAPLGSKTTVVQVRPT